MVVMREVREEGVLKVHLSIEKVLCLDVSIRPDISKRGA